MITDPWTEARALLPGYSLLRVIDLDAGTDSFEIVRARRGDRELLDIVLDGWTLIKPALDGGRGDAEIATILAAFDELWRRKRASLAADPALRS